MRNHESTISACKHRNLHKLWITFVRYCNNDIYVVNINKKVCPEEFRNTLNI